MFSLTTFAYLRTTCPEIRQAHTLKNPPAGVVVYSSNAFAVFDLDCPKSEFYADVAIAIIPDEFFRGRWFVVPENEVYSFRYVSCTDSEVAGKKDANGNWGLTTKDVGPTTAHNLWRAGWRGPINLRGGGVMVVKAYLSDLADAPAFHGVNTTQQEGLQYDLSHQPQGYVFYEIPSDMFAEIQAALIENPAVISIEMV